MFTAHLSRPVHWKNYTYSFNCLGATEGWNKCKKKISEKCQFFYFNKYQSTTHVSTSIFQGLFKNIIFRSVGLVTNLEVSFFYTDRTFCCPVPYPTCKFSLKVTKAHGESVKNQLGTKKIKREVSNPSPPLWFIGLILSSKNRQ